MHKLLLIFILSTLVWANNIFTKEENDWIKSNPSVKISMLNNFQPFSYISNNQHKGFSVDLINQISKVSGLKFEIKTSSWSKALDDFKNGKTDIISDISYTDERSEYALFTEPYYEIPTFVFGLKNDSTYKNNKSLIGKKVGVSRSIFYKNDLINMGLDVIEFDSSNEKAKAIVTGKIDYFLASYTSGIKAINSQSLITLKAIDEFKSIKKEDLRFGVSKDKLFLKSILQKSLNSLESNFLFTLANTWVAKIEENAYNQINFTQEELDFINKHPKIKIGSIDTYIPFSFVYNEKKVGFTQELLDIISKKSGLTFEKVGGTWPEVFGKFKNNQIDVISELSYRKERVSYTLYTKPYYEIPISVFANSDFGSYTGLKSLENKKVGIVKNSYLIDVLNQDKDIKIVEFDTNNDKFYALRDKKVDAVISGAISIHRLERLLIKGIKPIGLFVHDEAKNEDLRFGIRKEKPILASIMRKTLDSIPFSTITQLKQKWILDNYHDNLDDDKKIVFNEKEKEFIKNNPELTYSEINWKPLSIIENNTMNGIMGEYLNIISQRTGIKFKYIPSNNWLEVLDKFKEKKIDIVPGIGSSPQETKLGFTSHTYSSYPMVVVTTEKFNYIQNLNELSGKTVAVPKGYTSYNFLIENYPKLNIRTTSDIKEALIMVESGEADAFIGHIATSLYNMSELHLRNLKISGITNFTFQHKYLIQKDSPVLISIINKVLDSITEIEKKEIHSKWIQPLVVKETVDYSLIYKLLIAFLIVLGIILYFLNKLKKQKKEFETIFKISKDGIAITDLKTNFLECNEAYLKMLGYTKNELINKSSISLTAPEYIEKTENALDIAIKEGYIKNFEKVTIGKNGRRVRVNITISVLPDKKRLLFITKDVTSLKLFENNLKLASMGEMIGNIAHQWRQPLSVITTSASGLRLKSEYGENIKDEEIQEFSEKIIEQARYLSETIDDFKNFIKGTTEFRIIDIKDIIQSSLSLTFAATNDNYIKVIKKTDESIKIDGNRNELEQVLINIINNSKDALVENVKDTERYIFIETKKINNKTLELKVYDNGGGILEKNLDRIFEPYFTTKHKSIGTGLGLSIVDKIIRERHKQMITVYNEEFKYEGKSYKGACFSIIFKSDVI
ncbi:transporter substrate-binding domain-containing protein [Halarcobacter sp.]|uniref:transporter substrate-binding domain-containing protein n=1 Tax=Halarcobacter sp. TaxID=2321133 RepID=UPI0029F49035|nr:transporter substrate-binding domain-containing protein [Halarcobacter sp.]